MSEEFQRHWSRGVPIVVTHAQLQGAWDSQYFVTEAKSQMIIYLFYVAAFNFCLKEGVFVMCKLPRFPNMGFSLPSRLSDLSHLCTHANRTLHAS
jgi:hypothetical protein